MSGQLRVAVGGLRPDLVDALGEMGLAPSPWDGGPLDDDAVALVMGVGEECSRERPDGRVPVLAVHEGEPPSWASFSVHADAMRRDFQGAVLAVVAEGVRRATLRAERGTVADLVDLLCHDVRNPLAAVRANLALLEMSSLDADAAEAVGDSVIAADSALNIVENLALMASVEAGRPRVKRGTTDARTAVLEAVGRVRPASEAAEIPVVADDPGHSVPCACGGEALGTILDNLIGTALRYAPRGTDVRVRLEQRVGSVLVTVSEAGAPVPANLAPGLFDRSSQLRSKSAPEGRYGRGLGLYVAALVASESGGTLTVAQVRGRNTYQLDLGADRGDLSEAE